LKIGIKNYGLVVKEAFQVLTPNIQVLLEWGPGANPNKSLPSPNVWAFSEDASAKYLFVGTDLGISRLDRTTGLFDHFNRWNKEAKAGEKEGRFNVLSSYCIDSMTLLVGFEDGLFRLDLKENTHFSYTRLNYVNPILLTNTIGCTALKV
jgi:hypothetical protein